MKVFLVGLWVAIVTLGSTCAAVYLAVAPKPAETKEGVALQLQKTRVMNVPILSDGRVQGFIVAQFGYTIDGNVLKKLPVTPEIFLLDEAFRTLYSDTSLDFKHLDRYNLNDLKKHLADATNSKLGADLVKEVLIQDFAFVNKQAGEP